MLLLGCRAGKTVTEWVVRETDSVAVWVLRDSLQLSNDLLTQKRKIAVKEDN